MFFTHYKLVVLKQISCCLGNISLWCLLYLTFDKRWKFFHTFLISWINYWVRQNEHTMCFLKNFNGVVYICTFIVPTFICDIKALSLIFNIKYFHFESHTLREKCPNTEYFWSVFSCIPTEYRKIQTRNNSVFGHFSRSDSR